MDELSAVGAFIGLGGAICSAISSSSMFYRKRDEERVKGNAEGDPKKRRTITAKEELTRRLFIQDRLNLIGTGVMLLGAILTVIGIFVGE